VNHKSGSDQNVSCAVLTGAIEVTVRPTPRAELRPWLDLFWLAG